MFVDTQLALFDVVAFQECFAFGSSRRDFLIQKGKDVGLAYYAACLVRYWSASIDVGLLILSRFEIEPVDFIVFDRGVHSD